MSAGQEKWSPKIRDFAVKFMRETDNRTAPTIEAVRQKFGVNMTESAVNYWRKKEGIPTPEHPTKPTEEARLYCLKRMEEKAFPRNISAECKAKFGKGPSVETIRRWRLEAGIKPPPRLGTPAVPVETTEEKMTRRFNRLVKYIMPTHNNGVIGTPRLTRELGAVHGVDKQVLRREAGERPTQAQTIHGGRQATPSAHAEH